MHCPKCDAEMERVDSEPDVGLVGGWECGQCGEFVGEWDDDQED